MRVFSVICIFVLALCLAVSADADDTVYQLPDNLKAVSATADQISLPDGLPEHAHVVSFSNENGLISVTLDREVPSLKIKELNFVKGEESTIFLNMNTATAEAHQYGEQCTRFFSAMVTWKMTDREIYRGIHTWSGDLAASAPACIEKAVAGQSPSWDSAGKDRFQRRRVLLSET